MIHEHIYQCVLRPAQHAFSARALGWREVSLFHAGSDKKLKRADSWRTTALPQKDSRDQEWLKVDT